MYKLEVKLKQHTPLIHFQWEQKGATLRASEVKPKLDRFVLEKLVEKKEGDSKEDCYNKGLERAKTKGWLIGESKALDYKMKIKSSGEKTEWNKPPMYFGGDDKKGVSYDQELDLTISSFYNEVIELLKRYLSEFFFCYNFGCRQSKGYGGFSVEKINDSVVSDNIEACLKDNFNFVYKRQQGNTLAEIKEDYQKIKSGTNYKEYTKSLLFCYVADEKNKEELKWGNFPRWEKRKLKKLIRKLLEQERFRNLGLQLKVDDEDHKPIAHIKPNNVDWEDRDRKGNLVDFNYLYLRALLGITDQYVFALQKKNNKCDYRVIVKVKANEIDRYEIDRYSSPLLFKIINNTIYLVGKDNINNKLLGREFQFTIYLEKQKEGKFTTIKQEEIAEPIKVPESFSLSKFIEYAMAYQDEKGNKILKYDKI